MSDEMGITQPPYKVIDFDGAQMCVIQDAGDGKEGLIANFTGDNRAQDAYAYSLFPTLLKLARVLVDVDKDAMALHDNIVAIKAIVVMIEAGP